MGLWFQSKFKVLDIYVVLFVPGKDLCQGAPFIPTAENICKYKIETKLSFPRFLIACQMTQEWTFYSFDKNTKCYAVSMKAMKENLLWISFAIWRAYRSNIEIVSELQLES